MHVCQRGLSVDDGHCMLLEKPAVRRQLMMAVIVHKGPALVAMYHRPYRHVDSVVCMAWLAVLGLFIGTPFDTAHTGT